MVKFLYMIALYIWYFPNIAWILAFGITAKFSLVRPLIVPFTRRTFAVYALDRDQSGSPNPW